VNVNRVLLDKGMDARAVEIDIEFLILLLALRVTKLGDITKELNGGLEHQVKLNRGHK